MDIVEKFKTLYKMLDKHNLEWVCAQVIEEIKNGKVSEVNGHFKREDYTDEEKYALLLNGYKSGLLDPLLIKQEIKNTHMSSLDSILFFDEEAVDVDPTKIQGDKVYVNDRLKDHIASVEVELSLLGITPRK